MKKRPWSVFRIEKRKLKSIRSWFTSYGNSLINIKPFQFAFRSATDSRLNVLNKAHAKVAWDILIFTNKRELLLILICRWRLKLNMLHAIKIMIFHALWIYSVMLGHRSSKKDGLFTSIFSLSILELQSFLLTKQTLIN